MAGFGLLCMVEHILFVSIVLISREHAVNWIIEIISWMVQGY